MLGINLSGKRAFIAGVADDGGFGFAIAKALAEAGASITVGTWPPAMGIFENLLERGKIADSLVLADGTSMAFERIYPLDAAYDTMEQVPQEIRDNKRYRERGDFTIAGVVERLTSDFGPHPVDIVVHSLANGPEVRNQLLDTSRRGYLDAISVSAYSNIALVRAFGPLMRDGGNFLSLTYMAGERVIPGYGGGMSTAKAALESDTRTIAYEAGRRWGVRVNTISAGPYASRAASAIGFIDTMIRYCRTNAPLTRDFEATDVGHTAAFLASPLAAAITGSTVYVDNGYHAHRPEPGEGPPSMTARTAATIGALLAGLAVAAGAFGAHALRKHLEPRDLEIFETAARYQMYHGLALLITAWLLDRGIAQAGFAAWGFTIGTLVFSGSLYLMVFTGMRWLGAITPLGGVAMLVGWIALAIAARKL